MSVTKFFLGCFSSDQGQLCGVDLIRQTKGKAGVFFCFLIGSRVYTQWTDIHLASIMAEQFKASIKMHLHANMHFTTWPRLVLLTGVPLTEAFRVCVRVVPVRFGMWVWQFLSSARTDSSDRGMSLVVKCDWSAPPPSTARLCPKNGQGLILWIFF